ncbi:MAG: hypothetical protein AB7V46_16690 [Thermomicrobiales bacterium]
MKTKWRTLFFVEGDEATEYLQMLQDVGAEEVCGYLLHGLDGSGPEHDEDPSGDDGARLELGNYVLTWNRHLQYVGLYEQFAGGEE